MRRSLFDPLREAPEFNALALIALFLVCLGFLLSLTIGHWMWIMLFGVPALLLIVAGVISAFTRDPRPSKPPWACRKCGYDRRGLPPRSPCPECGAHR